MNIDLGQFATWETFIHSGDFLFFTTPRIITYRHRFYFVIALYGLLNYNFTMLPFDIDLIHALDVINTIINPLRYLLDLPPLGFFLLHFTFLC